jgi:hypothetical protein
MHEIRLTMAQDFYVVHSRGAVSSELSLVLHVWCATYGQHLELPGLYKMLTSVGWWPTCLRCLSLHGWSYQELAAAVPRSRPRYMRMVFCHRLLPP